jgi:hypothetical protein
LDSERSFQIPSPYGKLSQHATPEDCRIAFALARDAMMRFALNALIAGGVGTVSEIAQNVAWQLRPAQRIYCALSTEALQASMSERDRCSRLYEERSVPISTNTLLASLSKSDFALLAPHLEPVALELRKALERPNRRIDAAYFPESGFASVVAIQPGGKQIEIGLIGREGMSGLPIVLGDHRTPQPGTVRVSQPRELRRATQTSVSLRDSLLKYVQAFGVQTAHTAISNAQSRTDVRLARWLLMAHDRGV